MHVSMDSPRSTAADLEFNRRLEEVRSGHEMTLRSGAVSVSGTEVEERRMTVLQWAESIKEFGKRKVKDWWNSGQILIQRVQAWRDSTSDKLHPCLSMPLLALIDAANLCIFGIGLLAFIAVGLFFFCSFMLVMMAPFLTAASWLSSYLLPPVDKPFHPSLLIRHTIFVLGSILLIGFLYMLNRSVKKTNPDSNLADFLTNYVEGLPMLSWIGVTYILWTLTSACCVVFTFDFTLAVGWGFLVISFCLYYFFLFCFLLIRHIPWFVLLPLAVFLPLFVTSLFRRVNSHPILDDDIDQRYDPRASSYGTI